MRHPTRLLALLTALLATAALLLLPSPAQAERPWATDRRGDGARGLDITRVRYDYSGPYVGAEVHFRNLGKRGTVRDLIGIALDDLSYIDLRFTRKGDGTEIREAYYFTRDSTARVRCPVSGTWSRGRDLVSLRVSFACLRQNRHTRDADFDSVNMTAQAWRRSGWDEAPTRFPSRN